MENSSGIFNWHVCILFLYSVFAACLLDVQFSCWGSHLVWCEIPSILFLLLLQTFWASVFAFGRHVYYSFRGNIVQARVVEPEEQQEPLLHHREQHRSVCGTLQELFFCYSISAGTKTLEYEATQTLRSDGLKTHYQTIRVQKVFSALRSHVTPPYQVMLLANNPRSAILYKSPCLQIFGILVFFINVFFLAIPGAAIPLYVFGYDVMDFDSTNEPECNEGVFGYDVMDFDSTNEPECNEGCQALHVRAAYIGAALAGSLLIRIRNVLEPSVEVFVEEQDEMTDLAFATSDNVTEATEVCSCIQISTYK